MPTYRARLDVNIAAPDEKTAREQIPGYIKNHLILSVGPGPGYIIPEPDYHQDYE
jgi:hypothetical protein